MANPVFTIVPNPHWVIIDNFSKLPNGAAIYTYRHLNPTEFKPAFRDAAGLQPYGQPIVGFGNGTMPPIFWEFDPNNPTETYYIRVYDSSDIATQNFLWDFDGLSGSSGGGGGTVITATDIENLVINGTFYRHTNDLLAGVPTSVTLAPSNNAGYVNDSANPEVITNGPVGPDIVFAKTNNSDTDTLSFIPFTPFGIQSLGTDITPPLYLNYTCTAGGGGITYKYVQFPIAQPVESLAGQGVTVKIFARSINGDSIELAWRQFFGSGAGASADVLTPIAAAFPLTNPPYPAWGVYTFTTTIPTVTGKIAGSCGNSALFLQIRYPGSPTKSNVDIVKPAIYLGNIQVVPAEDFHSNDMINAIIDNPRTGDVRISLNSYLPGWVIMNDGTIGNAISGSTTRANADTYPLFFLIWTLFKPNQALAPMFNGIIPVPYGLDATTDFEAGRRLSLTLQAGRVIAGISGGHAIGTTIGAETHAQIAAEVGPHVHPPLVGTGFVTLNGGGTDGLVPLGGALAGPATTGLNAPAGAPFNIMQPTVYNNIFIKL